MTRNHKGGKQHRKSSGGIVCDKRQLEYKEEGQEYALITKMLGNGRCECKCADGLSRLGVIRGKMNKRVWINMGDTVLVSLREYQDSKVDIIHKYTIDEVKALQAYGEIETTTTAQVQEIHYESDNNDDIGVDFDDI